METLEVTTRDSNGRGPHLPPGQLIQSESIQTPAQRAGSFLIDNSGKCPVDELTGLPLPIAPTVDIDAALPHKINEHHHFYPRLGPVLRDTLGGRALRVSRIQRVGIEQHNFGENPFHTFFPEGPDVPTDPREQLGFCVLACAGYLPESVVDTSAGEPLIRDMKTWEFDRLRRPNSYVAPLPIQVKRYRDRRFPHMSLLDAKERLINSRKKQAELTYRSIVYGFDPMKRFIAEQMLLQDFEEVRPNMRNSFLDREDISKGLAIIAIGTCLAAESASVNGRPLNEIYVELRKAGRIHPLMPPSPSTLIKNKLGHTQNRVDLLPRLRTILAAGREDSVA